MADAPLTFYSLAKETGRDQAGIKKWLIAAHMWYDGEFLVPRATCVEEINRHTRHRDNEAWEKIAEEGKVEVDDRTGMQWKDALDREKTLELRRLNRIAEKTETGDYMPTATHLERTRAIIDRIEQIHDRAKSELALTDLQSSKLLRLLDDCREEAVKEITQAQLAEEKEECTENPSNLGQE